MVLILNNYQGGAETIHGTEKQARQGAVNFTPTTTGEGTVHGSEIQRQEPSVSMVLPPTLQLGEKLFIVLVLRKLME